MSHGNSHMFASTAICIVSAVVHSMLLGGLDFKGLRVLGLMSSLALEQCQDEPSSSLIDLNDFEFERRKIDLAVPWLRQRPESTWRHEKS